MQILDGKKIAKERTVLLKEKIAKKIKNGNRIPKLVVLMVGENETSKIYVGHKLKLAKEIGIKSEVITFASDIESDDLYNKIDELNNDLTVDGILLQLPIPDKFEEEKYLQAISPSKDVDGFHYLNQGRLLQGYDTVAPCTPLGVINLLKAFKIEIQGIDAVVLGTSNIVGKPLGIMLMNLGATVTFCNKNTKNIKNYTKNADIIFSATGHKFIITKDMVKLGSIVVDIGIIRDLSTNKLVGDVDFENVAPLTNYITPVPGGVGPMTVITLLENTYNLYCQHIS